MSRIPLKSEKSGLYVILKENSEHLTGTIFGYVLSIFEWNRRFDLK